MRAAVRQAGLTPASCLERVRRSAGEAAVSKIKRDVEDALRIARDRAERDAMHASPGRTISRRVALRDSL